ncbi:calcium-activated chloride channel regulator 2 isoform X2 [Peromyscus maniculatus bairdii]|uniref:Calcium-activated chloride channel regulator 2 n=1 Tax=Peromyscus maniculatus bairdii TaxID=230844 RepID=A0A6I9LUE1_PERMB|nr:calcium-activated chloride channel regulator 2 isoform X2 [Peromyscus maniculatus bairdii]
MTHRGNPGPVHRLKLVTLLFALSPELLFLGAAVKLQDNGYDGLLVAINPRVPENLNLITNMKEMITEASFYLFNATKRRVFFRNIQILIPATWTAHNYSKVKQESYEKANVIVTEQNGVHGDDPYTLQHRGCGKEGKYIHFTPSFLLNDELAAGYGSRGRVFVHEWAHLRWGVFDEYNHDKPFYMNGRNEIQVTRCSSDITGVFVCEKGLCPQEGCIISKLFREGCTFLYNSTQNATGSIMFMQSLSSVVEFCNASTHNREAPNLQNQVCSLRSTWDVITGSSDLNHSLPMSGVELPPPPTFSLMQAGDKVLCLVMDVSRKMAEADRLLRLQQAAELYLMQVVEVHTFVGIVTFDSKGAIRAQLQQINSADDRKLLVSYLPTTASTEEGVDTCAGIKRGFEVIEKRNGRADGSVMILVTSGADEHINNCLLTAMSSGSTIHSIALGSSAVRKLEELSHLTGGLKFFIPDESNPNRMTEAFSRISSGTGDIFQQSLQLESVCETVQPQHQLLNSVTVDSAVGNDTIFVVMWQTSGPPEIILLDPSGRKYNTSDFVINLAFRTAIIQFPGTAKPGHWTYILNNTHRSPQALKVTVASRASSLAVSPATVEAFAERDSTYFPQPVIIYANVRKGLYPILNATVVATVEPEAGDPIVLQLLDNGAGADVIKRDGIYSRYFFSFAVSGRYSLTVHVHHSPSISTLDHSVPGSHAMYVPGYIANDNIQMNAPKKTGHRGVEEQWGFSRVSSGGSFSVLGVPAGPHPDMFPPCKITDLEAIKAEEDVILSWTAPGENFDQGQATSYEIRMSKNLQSIRDNFNNAILVNTSELNPQQAGTREIFTFSLKLVTSELEHEPDGKMQENHVVYVAMRAVDQNSLKSDVSNIALVSLSVSQNSAPALSRDELILKGVLVAVGLIAMVCLIIVAAHCTLNRKKRALKKDNVTKLL